MNWGRRRPEFDDFIITDVERYHKGTGGRTSAAAKDWIEGDPAWVIAGEYSEVEAIVRAMTGGAVDASVTIIPNNRAAWDTASGD